MQGVIYIDILYFINFTLDVPAFWATARFISCRPKAARLLAASFIGAAASLIAVIMLFHIAFSIFPVLLIMLLSLHILLPGKTAVFLFKALGVYFLIAFAMAGAAVGGKTVLADESLQNSWKVLIFALAAALLISCYGMGRLMRKW